MDHPPNMEQTLVSIDRIDSTHIRLHSKATLPKEILTNFDFWDVLHSWPNQSLWRNFQCDGDGTWIRRGAMRGTLRMVHHGSYMSKIDLTICYATFIITCVPIGQKAMGTILEQSDFADNYRAEGLGAIVGLPILKAATRRLLPYKECLAYCDNLGIVHHANRPNKPMSEKQSQGDIIGLIKNYIRELDFEVPCAHFDEVLQWDQLTDIQKLNGECNTLAKEALLNGIVGQEFISSCFTFEDIVLNC